MTAGDHVEAGVTPTSSSFDATTVGVGSVLCDPSRPVALAKRFEVQLRALSARLLKGQPFELYCHTCSCAAVLRKIVGAVDGKTGARMTDARPPRSLLPGSMAIVQLELERAIPVELHSACRHLGRIVLRDGGETVAAGLVTSVKPYRGHTSERG